MHATARNPAGRVLNDVRRSHVFGVLAIAQLAAAVLAGCVQDARAEVCAEQAVIVRPMAPGQPASGYVDIRNDAAEPDRLMSATSAHAQRIVLHEMIMDGDMMRMRDLHNGLDIPGRQVTSLADAGVHLMINGLSGSLAAGDTIPVVLHFARAGDVPVTFTIVTRPPAASQHGHH